MKIIYGVNKIRKFKRPVVALGVFDGVHRAHIKILRKTVKKARRIRGTSIVLTFYPHPQRQESLYSLKHRLKLIAGEGINISIVVNFNAYFSRISAKEFIKDILFKKIHARYVYIGKNFRFGKGAKGNFRILAGLAKIYKFKVRAFDVIKIKNKPVSSTYIRSLIKKGDIAGAQKLLGRPVTVLGTVIRGNLLARELGFPTANINPHHEVIPPAGIYAVRIIFKGKKFNSLCYIGTRPTFFHQKSRHIEVYIFNFNRDIYGEDLEIQFIKKIRNERKFNSADTLVKEIKKDIARSSPIFSSLN